MRSAGATNLGLPWVVVASTNSTIAFLAAPSFHEGSGSVWAIASALDPSQATSASKRPADRMVALDLMIDLLSAPEFRTSVLLLTRESSGWVTGWSEFLTREPHDAGRGPGLTC